MAFSSILKGAMQVYPRMLRSPLTTVNSMPFSRLTTVRNGHLNRTSTILTKKLVQANFFEQPKRDFGDHSVVWTAEKIVSTMLVPLIPATIFIPNAMLDNLLAIVVVTHFNWGVQAVVKDYIRPVIFGNVIPGLVVGITYICTMLTLGGFLYFNYHDIGMGQTIRKLWSLQPRPPPSPPLEELRK